jgi:di- and tripeptidase
METEAGDIFSLAWCPLSETIYLGCQNTSIQFLQCSQLHSGDPDVPAWDSGRSDGSTPSTPSLGSVSRKSKVHKFFNSYPQYERRPADVFAVNGLRTQRDGETSDCVDGVPVHAPLAVLDIPVENVVDSAHYGYVYCIAPIPSIRDGSDDAGPNRFSQHLVTGSGDETLKVPISILCGFLVSIA